MEDLNDKAVDGTLPAGEWNQVPSEIQNVIEGLGITLTNADLNQLGKAISGYVANGTFYTDSGAADTYVLAQIGSKQAVPAYTNGMIARFLPVNANTGASTVNVSGLGVKAIEKSGGALVAGDIAAGDSIEMWYDGTAFQIIQSSVTASDTVAGLIEIATQAEQEAGSDTTRAVTPGRQQFHQSALKAWVVFDGTGTIAIKEMYNVSSIIDNGTGDTTVNFTQAFSSVDYGYSGSGMGDDSFGDVMVGRPNGGLKSTTACRLKSNTADGPRDTSDTVMFFFGDQ